MTQNYQFKTLNVICNTYHFKPHIIFLCMVLITGFPHISWTHTKFSDHQWLPNCLDNFKNLMHSSIYLYRRANIQNQEEKASGIMIIPRWVTQVWFPKMAAILGDSPILLPSNILNLPFTDSTTHLLYPKLKLLAADLSGKPSDTQTLQQTLTIKSQNEDSYILSWYVP